MTGCPGQADDGRWVLPTSDILPGDVAGELACHLTQYFPELSAR